jgi:hypothetical protein
MLIGWDLMEKMTKKKAENDKKQPILLSFANYNIFALLSFIIDKGRNILYHIELEIKPR